jgi:peptidyl-prolyl cis-trans isomerase
MKRTLHILPSLLFVVAVLVAATACSKSEDDSAERWRTANDAAFAAVKRDAAYTELKSPGNEGSIYYKELKKGTGTKPILFTSVVSLYARGWFVADYPGNTYIRQGTVFQSWLEADGVPFTTVVSNVGVIPSGFSAHTLTKGVRVALQYMHEGDKWEVWVPYTLGLGENEGSVFRSVMPSATATRIPAYATLVFEIEVVGVHS